MKLQKEILKNKFVVIPYLRFATVKAVMIKVRFLIILFGFFIIASCNKKSKYTPVCDGSNPTYNSTIAAIITSNCTGCHSEYSTYSGLSSVISNGEFKKKVITNQTMPENSSLTEAQLNSIQCWVDNGYPEN